jgi:hypothetical protein
MKKIYFSLLFLLIIPFSLSAQDVLWVKQFNGAGDMVPAKRAIDNKDNSYIVGTFTGTISNGIASLTAVGTTDIFIAKYDQNGQFKWIRSAGGAAAADVVNGVVVTSDGNGIYVTGFFTSKIKFSATDSLVSTGASDIYLARYDSSGNITLFKNIGKGASSQRATAMFIDNTNSNLVVAGFFVTSINFGTNTLTTTRAAAMFMAKFDLNGNDLLVNKIDITNNTSRIFSIELGTDGYYFGGFYTDSAFFSTGTLVSPANQEAFFLKTDFSFNSIWNRKIGGNKSDFITSVTTDLAGNAYIGGYYLSASLSVDSTASLKSAFTCPNAGSPTNNNIFWAKYSSSGNLIWINYALNNGDAQLYRAVSRQNTFIVAGYFTGQITVKGITLTSNGAKDFFGLVFDKDNNLIYAIGFGGSGNEVGETGLIDSKGNFIFAGDYTSPSFSIGTHTLTNEGLRDMFLVKYKKGSLSILKNNPSCFGGSTGSISVTPQGTVSTPFTFAWTKIGDGTFTRNTQNITGLNSGSYIVKFDDVFNFEIIDTVTLIDPAQLTVTLASKTDVNCFNGNDGKININVIGGTPGYTHNWFTADGGGIVAGAQNQAALLNGHYADTVTDSKGCKAGLGDSINQPAKVSAKEDSIKCVTIQGAGDGKIYISPSGGTAPYTYLWSNNDTTRNLLNASGGNYTVVVKDSKLCLSDTLVASMCEPGVLLIFDTLAKDISCNGLSNGIIKTYATGGVKPYTFAWTKNGSAYAAPDTNSLYTLALGDYVITVTDNSSAHASSRSITISQPTVLSVTLTPTNVSCNGSCNGNITSTPTGGTLPYTYLWTKTGDASFTRTTPVVSSLCAGTYTLTVTDKNGCTSSASKDITEPAVLSISNATVINQTCNNGTHNGSIVISVAGGTPPYQETWSNGKTGPSINLLSPGIYTVNVTDANGCSITPVPEYTISEPSAFSLTPTLNDPKCYGDANGSINLCVTGNNPPYNFIWSNGHTTLNNSCSLADSLAIGMYHVSITDSKNCDIYRDSLILSQPDSISISTNAMSDTICHGATNGFIQPSVSGGTTPYDYNWSPIGDITKTVSGLSFGTDTLLVTDNNGCTSKHWWTIVESPYILSISNTVVTDQTCNGGTNDGSICITPSGGRIPYTVLWSTTDTTLCLSQLSPGPYSVTITDAGGCSVQGNYTVNQPSAFVFTPTLTNPRCFGSADGSINLCVSGNHPPYSFNWSNGHTTTDSLCSFNSGLADSSYNVTITDSLNCSGTKSSMTLNQPSDINIASNNTGTRDTICFGASNGQIQTTVIGGTPGSGYSYNWNPSGDISNNESGLGKGTDTLLVTDANGCIKKAGWTITETPAIVIDSVTIVLDTIHVYAKGGFNHLNYTLLGGETNSTGKFQFLSSGTDTIRVSDSLTPCYHDTIVIVTGISKFKSNQEFLLYPNPFRNEFIMEITSAKTNRYTAEVMNMIGQKVYTRNIETSVGIYVKESFDLSAFPSGIYLFKMNDANGSVTQRILKQ